MYNEILQAISTVGFPIAMSVAMGVFIKHLIESHQKEIKEMTETHKEESDTMKEAVMNNTMAIQRLTDYLMREEDHERNWTKDLDR